MAAMCSVTKASLPMGMASSGSSETVSPRIKIPLYLPSFLEECGEEVHCLWNPSWETRLVCWLFGV